VVDDLDSMKNGLKGIEFIVEKADALELSCDVLALKYADAFHGVDRAAADRLGGGGAKIDLSLSVRWDFQLIPSKGLIGAKAVLFVGVGPLRKFGYEEIRKFGKHLLASLASAEPNCRHLAITVHGPGFGLDEREAFAAEIAGLADGLNDGDFPANLERITVAEIDPNRARRLALILNELLPAARAPERENPDRDPAFDRASRKASVMTDALKRLKPYGRESNAKRSIFVAMPFDDEMDDVWEFGIYRPVQSAGFLCERVDNLVFAGDIVDTIKTRISNSSLVIADLSMANPNVYLEVGCY
jgi:hypothetical protein